MVSHFDIVERLRAMSMALCGGSLRQPEGAKIADMAADEIERLRHRANAMSDEVERLHAALSLHLNARANCIVDIQSMNAPETPKQDDLESRVLKFQCLELPGQPQGMHMGTSYLVQDLWNEVKRLRKELGQ